VSEGGGWDACVRRGTHPCDCVCVCAGQGKAVVLPARRAIAPTHARPASVSAACGHQVWGVGGKFGTSAAVGVVLPPAPQMVEKQGWSYVSRPNQVLRGAHEPQSEITSIAFSKVRVGGEGTRRAEGGGGGGRRAQQNIT
jgi:hypothetical protein